MMSEITIPEEILTIICSALGVDGDFHTLYNCALSSKIIADSALRVLYQYHELSPAFTFTDDDSRDKIVYFEKWTNLWRSIIVSSTSRALTFKPYCRYLRILDFRNLSALLNDPRFRSTSKAFWARPLSHLSKLREPGPANSIDTVAVINEVGDMVIPKATFVEEISGHLTAKHVARWATQTTRLKRMALWEGNAVGEGVGKTIAMHCENFDALDVFQWKDEDADQVFAQFLNDLRADSIQYLHFINRNAIAGESFAALGRHSNLKELKLNALSQSAMENLNALKGCTQVEVLFLEDGTFRTRLQELHNDVFLEVIAWLSACTKLRDITIKDFVDGPSILAAVAMVPEVQWSSLSLSGYSIRSTTSASFHAALPDQKSLESLSLSGNGEDALDHDLSIMVSSICQLENLKELTLRHVSEGFDMTHISTLAISLEKLEEFWTSGQELTADILPLLANLRNLKSVTLFALTQFDMESIWDFVQRLDPEAQKGFTFSLMAVDTEFALSEEEQQLIQDALRTRVGGRFDHVLWREAESDSSDSD